MKVKRYFNFMTFMSGVLLFLIILGFVEGKIDFKVGMNSGGGGFGPVYLKENPEMFWFVMGLNILLFVMTIPLVINEANKDKKDTGVREIKKRLGE